MCLHSIGSEIQIKEYFMKKIKNYFFRGLSIFLSIIFCIQVIPGLAYETLASELEDELVSKDTQTSISSSGTEIVSEDVTLRSEYVKHFLLNNGTYLAVQYNHPVHDLNENNEWVDYNKDFSFRQASENGDDFDGFISSSKGKEFKVSNSSDALKVKLTNKEETDTMQYILRSRKDPIHILPIP